MGRFIIRSFFEDIKNFKNMLRYRRKKIEQAMASPLPKTYGANELSTVIHPDKQKVIISSCEKFDSRTKIITFSACDNICLAPFRPGQGINIKIGTETTFFSIMSSPKEKDYSIIVSAASSDEVSKFLLRAEENIELEISGPTGLFYYSHLRDGNSILLVCDNSGVAPVSSICKHLAGNKNVVVRVVVFGEENYGFFKNLSGNISVLYVKNTNEIYETITADINVLSAVFVSGEKDFCSTVETSFNSFNFLRGRVRINISNPPVKRDVVSEKYNCLVYYRNEMFSFDCFTNETLLSAFERNNIPTQAKCKVGECGYCRCKLIKGEVKTVFCNGIDSRRSADEKYGFIHPCRSFPESDVKVKL